MGDEEFKPRFFHFTIDGHEKELPLELRGVVSEFVREMVEEYDSRKKDCYDLLKRHPDDESLKQFWTPEQIEAEASGAGTQGAIAKLRGTSFERISWHDVSAAHEENPEATILCIQSLFDGAEAYVKGGVYANNAIGFKSPFERAQFSYIRNTFITEWQPRGGIEASLVDTLAQCYVAWQYWLARSFSIANNEDSVIEQKARTKKPYDDGNWQAPRLTAAEYLERATQMADRFNRMFLRILRQMRDLRRYAAPVTINNPKQVNIANEGGNQTNVQKKVTRKKKAKKKQSGAKHPGRIPLRIAGQK
jgi:hypothetical protein